LDSLVDLSLTHKAPQRETICLEQNSYVRSTFVTSRASRGVKLKLSLLCGIVLSGHFRNYILLSTT
jgi:hypothetical protein